MHAPDCLAILVRQWQEGRLPQAVRQRQCHGRQAVRNTTDLSLLTRHVLVSNVTSAWYVNATSNLLPEQGLLS